MKIEESQEKTVEQITEEFEREQGIQSAPVIDSQSVVSNIEEIISTETLPEEPTVEVVGDDNNNIEIIDLTGETDESDDNNKENDIKSSPVTLSDIERWNYKTSSFRIPTSPGENDDGWMDRYRQWKIEVKDDNKRVRRHNKKAKSLREDIKLLEDCPTLLDTPTPNQSVQHPYVLPPEEGEKLKQERRNEMEDAWILADSDPSTIEHSEDRQDEIEEERNDSKRDYEWETGQVNHCESGYKRKRWWKYCAMLSLTLIP